MSGFLPPGRRPRERAAGRHPSTVTDNVVEYLTTVSLPAKAKSVRLGQTTSISVITARKSGALIVPTGAVTVEGGRNRTSPGAPTTSTSGSRSVRVWSARTGTEIITGLKAGDQVVLPGTGASPAPR